MLLVLFFHTDCGFSGGYIGVDVFFVISGFLITGLIIKNQQHVHKIMEQLTAKFENVFLLDPTEHCFEEHKQSIITVSRGVLYADNHHLSPLGAEVLLRPLLEPIIIKFK